MTFRWSRAADLLLAALAAACLALAWARVDDNISFHAPLQLATSSAEEEALFSIWSFAHGQPVYTDPLAVPYTGSYFNWLFYAVYGSAAASALRLFHLDDAWLPTISRLVTLAFAAVGAATFFAALRGSGRTLPFSTLLVLAIIAFFNPLSGLWLITARPDIGAAALEVAGVALFFGYQRAGSLGWLVLAALFLYAAWSFKQTAVSALGGIALTLLVRRDLRGLLVLAGVAGLGMLLALAALGPDYRHGLYLSQVHSGAQLRWGVEHFLTAAGKMPFILATPALIAWSFLARKKDEPRDPAELTVTLIVVVASVVEAVTSCKGGAADYYFIPLAIWSVLWLGLARRGPQPRWGEASLAMMGVVMLAGIAGVFLGWRGTLDCRQKNQPFEHLARYLAARPGPVFVQATYGDLPWISPTAPHFVLAYMYVSDRAAGVRFQEGGWENLMARAYFSTVVTNVNATGGETIGPTLLAPYRLVREETGFRYFERK